jgi:hypothetical protein
MYNCPSNNNIAFFKSLKGYWEERRVTSKVFGWLARGKWVPLFSFQKRKCSLKIL